MESNVFIRKVGNGFRPIIAVGAILCPRAAWALQTHGDPEGLYVHQFAHTFFAFSMGLLIYWLRKWGLAAHAGWRAIQYAAFFFILWNINAIVGHWLEELTELIVIKRSGTLRIEIVSAQGFDWLALIYYLVKLDHLLCVPALFCLMLGLRRLYRQPPGMPNGDAAA